MIEEKTHVALYLSIKKADYDKLVKLAKKNDRTITAEARRLLDAALNG